MKFGEAIEQARNGHRIAREGWNGKNMYVYMTQGRMIPAEEWVVRVPAHALTEMEKISGTVFIGPHLDMMSAQGVRIIGWLASQTDMLADDWYVVEQRDKSTPAEDAE